MRLLHIPTGLQFQLALVDIPRYHSLSDENLLYVDGRDASLIRVSRRNFICDSYSDMPWLLDYPDRDRTLAYSSSLYARKYEFIEVEE